MTPAPHIFTYDVPRFSILSRVPTLTAWRRVGQQPSCSTLVVSHVHTGQRLSVEETRFVSVNGMPSLCPLRGGGHHPLRADGRLCLGMKSRRCHRDPRAASLVGPFWGIRHCSLHQSHG